MFSSLLILAARKDGHGVPEMGRAGTPDMGESGMTAPTLTVTAVRLRLRLPHGHIRFRSFHLFLPEPVQLRLCPPEPKGLQLAPAMGQSWMASGKRDRLAGRKRLPPYGLGRKKRNGAGPGFTGAIWRDNSMVELRTANPQLPSSIPAPASIGLLASFRKRPAG